MAAADTPDPAATAAVSWEPPALQQLLLPLQLLLLRCCGLIGDDVQSMRAGLNELS
jgi:hypothetical protein